MRDLTPWGMLLVVLTSGGCQQASSTPAAPPVPAVTVSRPISQEVSDYEDFTGRTDAVSTVDVRPRVSGYIVKVGFKDGDFVKEGQPLYEIDPRPFQALLDEAKGKVEALRAQKKFLAIQIERYAKLLPKQAISQQEFDQTVAQQGENLGSLNSAIAQVAKADLNLEFTKIASPVTGRMSRTQLTPGNLANADTTLLTTVMTLDPMYAYFDIEEPTLLRLRKMIREGVILSKSIHEVEVLMGLADDVNHEFPLRGTLDFVNNTVDPQTGTILVRGVFANPYDPDRPPVLVPGLFVRVRLKVSPRHKTLLVTERAIGTDQGQKFVYVVGDGNKIAYRRVRLGQQFDGLQAIEEGLKPGEDVVVNGLQRIRPGLEVKPETVEMSTLAAAARIGGAEQPPKPATVKSKER